MVLILYKSDYFVYFKFINVDLFAEGFIFIKKLVDGGIGLAYFAKGLYFLFLTHFIVYFYYIKIY